MIGGRTVSIKQSWPFQNNYLGKERALTLCQTVQHLSLCAWSQLLIGPWGFQHPITHTHSHTHLQSHSEQPRGSAVGLDGMPEENRKRKSKATSESTDYYNRSMRLDGVGPVLGCGMQLRLVFCWFAKGMCASALASLVFLVLVSILPVMIPTPAYLSRSKQIKFLRRSVLLRQARFYQ